MRVVSAWSDQVRPAFGLAAKDLSLRVAPRPKVNCFTKALKFSVIADLAKMIILRLDGLLIVFGRGQSQATWFRQSST
jgi:hypothetical protein